MVDGGTAKILTPTTRVCSYVYVLFEPYVKQLLDYKNLSLYSGYEALLFLVLMKLFVLF